MRRSTRKKDFDRALELWKLDKHDEALELLLKCEKTTIRVEDLAEVYLYKGWVLEDKGHYDEALQSFETASSLSTDAFVVPYSLHGQGICHLNKENFAQATKLFKRACDLYETIFTWKQYQEHYYSCYSLFIHSILLCGHIEEALNIRRRLETRKDVPTWLRMSIARNFGHHYYRKSDFSSSIPYYEDALKFVKDEKIGKLSGKARGEILFYLGSACYQTEAEERGKKLIEEALDYLSDQELINSAKKYLEA